MSDKTHKGSMGTDRNPPSGTDTLKSWHGGKGSARRANSDQSKYSDGWDRIFGKNKQQQQPESGVDEAVKKQQAQDPRNG